MERDLVIEFARVTEAAAINCSKWIGRMEKNSADGAAVEAMRKMFDTINISGTVVIGEGEMDEAPMLYIGEKVGLGGTEVDIAVDPLEGTNLTAKNQPGAIAVMAVAEAGGLLHAPDMYMDKIIVGPRAKGAIDIDKTVEENLRNVAAALGKDVSEMTVCLLDRERHEHIKQACKALGARVKLITDGDVSPALTVAMDTGAIDMIQGRLVPEDDEQVRRMEAMGHSDVNQVYNLNDLVSTDDVMFIATGVTTGDVLRGIKEENGRVKTHTVVLRNATKTVRFIEAAYQKPHVVNA